MTLLYSEKLLFKSKRIRLSKEGLNYLRKDCTLLRLIKLEIYQLIKNVDKSNVKLATEIVIPNAKNLLKVTWVNENDLKRV